VWLSRDPDHRVCQVHPFVSDRVGSFRQIMRLTCGRDPLQDVDRTGVEATVKAIGKRQSFSDRRPVIAIWTAVGAAIAAWLVFTAVAAATPARATLSAPHLFATKTSKSAWMLPLFSWSPVSGADHYEFQLAADSHFNSQVLGGAGSFVTNSTRAAVTQTPVNGRYWWRVRAVSKSGSVSGWGVRTVTKNWSVAPVLLSPGNGRTVTYPTDPLVLTWRAVAGAVTYNVDIATDPKFVNLVGGNSLQTASNSLSPAAPLVTGTLYYWRVTPLDAERHEGKRSAAHSFRWSWPTGTATSTTDLVADSPNYFSDPQLSWSPVKGAARYELDVNFDSSFAPGSRVCCSDTTIATSYSSQKLLNNNTYYWRVRAIDVNGHQGQWKVGQSFTKTFDNLQLASVPGLHLRDNNGDLGAGASTQVPILAWQPVTGASSYQVDIVKLVGGVCQYGNAVWSGQTANTYWTPTGPAPSSAPYPPTGVGVTDDGPDLTAGTTYCARVRAVGDDAPNGRVYGDFSYMQPAFTFGGYPSGGGSGYGMQLRDDRGACATAPVCEVTPLFTWQPIAGATFYWVIVSRDPSFTTLVDYAATGVPAYAPRKTYADETTSYYWAVIPATKNGAFYPDPNVAPGRASFNKASTRVALLTPKPGDLVGENHAEQPVFQWKPVVGARMYHLQVSSDSTFASGILDDVSTDSTAYASTTTYPPGKRLYWRVQAIDENGIALTFSPAPQEPQRSFEWQLPRPQAVQASGRGDALPTFRWRPTPGAVSYDLHLVLPDGSTQDFNQISSPAWAVTGVGGLGLFRWSVRGEFPRNGSGTTPGPYSRTFTFTRTLQPPRGAHATPGRGGIVFSWAPKAGSKAYLIQVATAPDFSHGVDSASVEGPMYAPTMSSYPQGAKVFWRVAAVSADGTTGNFSKPLVAFVPKHAGS
jgi:hypothetical protein